MEDARRAHARDSSEAGHREGYSRTVRAKRHLYAVEGWGVGELMVTQGVILAHELPGSAGGTEPTDATWRGVDADG